MRLSDAVGHLEDILRTFWNVLFMLVMGPIEAVRARLGSA